MKEKIDGLLFTAAWKVSKGTAFKHARTFRDPVQSVFATSWSKKGCPVVISDRPSGEPDSYEGRDAVMRSTRLRIENLWEFTIKALRKSPPWLPPFTKRCRATLMAPADSPQLRLLSVEGF